ncbi:hypothetical protein HA402_008605 [Bradysia odoriphaga]|nr:hypothetical protein HA402_008605 [Bradysia odoriphaga]
MASKKSKHVTFKSPIVVDNRTEKLPVNKVSRHVACKLPIEFDERPNRLAVSTRVVGNRTEKLPLSTRPDPTVDERPKRLPVSTKLDPTVDERPKRLPVSIRLDPTAAGIIVEVRKLKDDVAQVQKDLAVETAARNELHLCVEQLKVDTAETKQLMAQAANEVRNPNSASKTLNLLMKRLPCKSLDELDWLLAFIANRSLQWLLITQDNT